MSSLLATTLVLLAPQDISSEIKTVTAAINAGRLEQTVRHLVGLGTRHVLSDDDGSRGTAAARTWMEGVFKEMVPRSGGRLTVERKEYTLPSRRLGRQVKLVNIVATLRGVSDPERVYVVGGHYDSINGNPRDARGDAPGANDDASGTAVVMEACRVMCEREFAATIKFVCYDGEEMGLLGSTAHAKELADDEVKVDGMITNDIVGNTMGMDGKRRSTYLRCFSYSPRGNDSTGRSLARSASRSARQNVKDLEVMIIYRGDRYGRGGDHRPFHAEGFPSIRFTEPREDYSRQHRNVTERDGKPYGDLPEFMDFAYLGKVCSVNVALLAELASAPAAPGRVSVSGSRTAYDVTVSWSPVKAAQDYELVWRSTTAADWQESRLVGEKVTRGRRGMSAVIEGQCLDDVVVGLRAVGGNGARSRVTVPPDPDAFAQRPSSDRKR